MKRLIIAAIMLLIIAAITPAAAEVASTSWRYKVEANCIAVSNDGSIVVGTGAEVIAIGKDGQESWYWDAPAVVEHLAFGLNGDVFVAYGSELAKLGVDG